MLAYTVRTEVDYWSDELDKNSGVGGNYEGLETIIENDPGLPGAQVFDFTSESQDYLDAAKDAYSKGLTKLKAGLQFIKDNRSDADKEAEDHMFNVADINDDVTADVNKVNIDKVIGNIDEVKGSLTEEGVLTCYDDYEDTGSAADQIGIDASSFFASPSRADRPTFYYHAISDEDMPIFDTNDTSSSLAFTDAFIDTLTGIKPDGEEGWKYFEDLEDLLSEDLLPDPYKFVIPYETIPMNGNLADFLPIRPVMFDEEDDDILASRDLIEVYLVRDCTYLYVGLRFDGTPFPGPFAAGEQLSY